MIQLILLCLFVSSVAAQCSFESGSLSARWQVINGELTVQFVNKNIGNNQWTAVAFGEDMSNLEVVLFAIENNKASMKTGYTKGYGPPILDSSANAIPEKIMFNSNQLNAVFSRPVVDGGPRNSNLAGCMTWNFISSSPLYNGQIGQHTTKPYSFNVCPTQCNQVFDDRNAAVNPVPQAAIYNNKQSSRYNGLQGNY